jgi:hypothetical protein
MKWRLPRTANRWMTALFRSWDRSSNLALHKSEAEIAASTLPELQLAQSLRGTLTVRIEAGRVGLWAAASTIRRIIA